MIKNVVKRNGQIVNFDKQKIVVAIEKAMQSTGNAVTKTSNSIADKIESIKKSKLSVEEIQDLVEEELMKTDLKDVARNYIRYRYLHKIANNKYNELIEIIEDKLFAKDVKNQNANVDEKSFGGRVGETINAIMKNYALDYLMSPKARYNHLNNIIYTHDLDSYVIGSHNCLSLPIDDLLQKPIKTRQVTLRPAQSVGTACQLVAVLMQLQSLNMFGGVAATHLDWTMVPYIRKSFYKHWKDGCEYILETNNSDVGNPQMSIDDDNYKTFNEKVYKYALNMTKKEVYQAVEALYHNLNSLQSRSGNQLPFSSINYGTCTLPEGRMFTKAILDVSIKGMGDKGTTSIFPCGIFQVGEGINKHKSDPNYDLFKLALKSTSLRLYPNYANIDWSGNTGYDKNDPRTFFSTMGCRTANGADINADEGVNPQMKDGRGNICPVTIIMPTVAMIAKEQANLNKNDDVVEVFMELLDEKIHEAKDQLIERFEWICSQSPDSAKFMYENNTFIGYKPEEGIRSALKHGTLSLGQIGLAETLEILIGCNHTTDKGMELAKRIEQLFKDRCLEFKNEYKLNFGVYYSPAENLAYTSMEKFKKQYGEIPKVSDKEFFTNSMHVPVWEEIDPFKKIDVESQLTGYSSAGCITYVELDGGCKNNLQALEDLVVYAMDKDIPYFAINVPNDTCLDCGFIGEFNDECPICHSKNIQQLRRVTGYLTGDYKTAFNKGKQKEVEMRVKHNNNKGDC